MNNFIIDNFPSILKLLTTIMGFIVSFQVWVVSKISRIDRDRAVTNETVKNVIKSIDHNQEVIHEVKKQYEVLNKLVAHVKKIETDIEWLKKNKN